MEVRARAWADVDPQTHSTFIHQPSHPFIAPAHCTRRAHACICCVSAHSCSSPSLASSQREREREREGRPTKTAAASKQYLERAQASLGFESHLPPAHPVPITPRRTENRNRSAGRRQGKAETRRATLHQKSDPDLDLDLDLDQHLHLHLQPGPAPPPARPVPNINVDASRF